MNRKFSSFKMMFSTLKISIYNFLIFLKHIMLNGQYQLIKDHRRHNLALMNPIEVLKRLKIRRIKVKNISIMIQISIKIVYLFKMLISNLHLKIMRIRRNKNKNKGKQLVRRNIMIKSQVGKMIKIHHICNVTAFLSQFPIIQFPHRISMMKYKAEIL